MIKEEKAEAPEKLFIAGSLRSFHFRHPAIFPVLTLFSQRSFRFPYAPSDSTLRPFFVLRPQRLPGWLKWSRGDMGQFKLSNAGYANQIVDLEMIKDRSNPSRKLFEKP